MLALVFTLALVSAPPAALATVETATTCRDTLKERLQALERTPPVRRARPTLEILATSCRLVPEPLREAAAVAARASPERRSHVLGEVSKRTAEAACRPKASAAPATELARACPLPPPMSATRELLGDLDEGTYAFGITVMQALAAAGVPRELGRRWFDDLALATGLERHTKARAR